MGESALQQNPEIQKRRSTRILQAVPLVVMGVDALGRPFNERTSTLIVNCHGCRYQSKHYVLKNMWVTLEVPHPEAGHAPRSLRARVMWIQRPRTVRELFHVGVELEGPGNLWGIAFPPPDWFPLSERAPGQAAPSLPSVDESAKEPPAQFPGAEESAATSAVPLAENNLRMMPGTGAAESSLEFTQQMQGLLNEAKEQLRAAVRETAAEAVSLETRPLLAALESQLKGAVEQSVRAAASAVAEPALRAALNEAERINRDHLNAVRDRWIGELNENVESAGQKLHEHLDAVVQERAITFDQQLDARLEHKVEQLQRVTDNLSVILNRAYDGVEAFRTQTEESSADTIRQIEQRVEAQAERGRAQLADIENAAETVNARLALEISAAASDWQGRLDADLAAAHNRWEQRIEVLITSATHQAAERMAHDSGAAAAQMERETGARIAALNQALAAAAAEAENKLSSLRASVDSETERLQQVLAQAQSAAREVSERTVTLEDLLRAAKEQMDERAATFLEAQTQALAHRAQEDLRGWSERLQPVLESAGQQTIARLGVEMEQQFAPHLDRAEGALGRLESGTRAADETFRGHKQELATASERTIESALGGLQTRLGQVERDFEETARTAVTKWLAELDFKATETTHVTFESLFKTAEWYEKKVQTQMQVAIEKGLEQAGGALREKACEVSGVFASELDHYSRSYVEHTQGQFEEAAREALERLRQLTSEMTATSASALAQQVHQYSESVSAEFRNKVGAVLDESSTRLTRHAEQFARGMEEEAQRSGAAFRAALTQDVHQAIDAATHELSSEIQSARVVLEAEAQKQQAHLTESANEAIDQYKVRLEKASGSWLLITMTKLNQQSQQHLDALQQSAAERLRQTCQQVFFEVGESMRQRMLELIPSSKPHSTPDSI